MYARNPEQAVNVRAMALRMRGRARETSDSFYRRLFQNAAIDLEVEAERREREAWKPH